MGLAPGQGDGVRTGAFMGKKRSEQRISRILFLRPVARIEGGDHSSGMPIARHLERPTRKLGRAALKRFPIWSCTGWGLPSFPGHPENWCALTAPFHPYPAMAAGRSAFCCTCLRVAATPRYGASCPVVFGLSSSPAQGGVSDHLPYSDRYSLSCSFQYMIRWQWGQ